MQPQKPPNETAMLDTANDRLPVEVGLTIVCAGIVGLVLPGPFGTPLIVGGGLSLWPRAFRPIDRWVQRRMPRAHESGTNWLIRFQADLHRRYPAGQTAPFNFEAPIAPTCTDHGPTRNGKRT